VQGKLIGCLETTVGMTAYIRKACDSVKKYTPYPEVLRCWDPRLQTSQRVYGVHPSGETSTPRGSLGVLTLLLFLRFLFLLYLERVLWRCDI